jgi:hypothetical protein
VLILEQRHIQGKGLSEGRACRDVALAKSGPRRPNRKGKISSGTQNFCLLTLRA